METEESGMCCQTGKATGEIHQGFSGIAYAVDNIADKDLMIAAAEDLIYAADHRCKSLIKDGQIKRMQMIRRGLKPISLIMGKGLGNLLLAMRHDINGKETAVFDGLSRHAAKICAE